MGDIPLSEHTDAEIAADDLAIAEMVYDADPTTENKARMASAAAEYRRIRGL